jgi:hypothetical protein
MTAVGSPESIVVKCHYAVCLETVAAACVCVCVCVCVCFVIATSLVYQYTKLCSCG